MRLLFFTGFFILFTGLTYGQKTIEGRVSNGGDVLSNVQIANLSTGAETTSNQEGRYQIKAEPKEELQFIHSGMDTISIIVEDVTRILNIKMNHEVEELDEVTVAGKKRKTHQEKLLEYSQKKTMIRTAFGFLDKETASYSLRIADEDDFENAPNINSVIRGAFAGVNAQCDPMSGKLGVSMRSVQSINMPTGANFDVDGQLLTEVYCSWLWGNVKRMAFIPSLSAMAKYGEFGRGGIVVINTISGSFTPTEQDGGIYDHAKLRNNVYKQNALNNEVVVENAPQYLKEIKSSKSKNEAFEVYQKNAQKYRSSYHFALENYRYFFNEWNDESTADKILEENALAFKNNPVALKSLAYVYEAQGRYKKAHDTYKQIYILRPDYAQSFIDMAKSYRNLGEAKSATSLFARHAYLQEEGLLPKDTVDLSRIMKREVYNLFALDNGSLQIKSRKWTTRNQEYSTRLVFEWNDSEAEFDLQFVNPGNQYFNWKHTLAEMPERIRSEKELGYSMADFLMDDELPGTWKVNARYHGNKQLTPSYIKVTVYHNYGSKLQSKDVKVFRLGIKGVNQHLFDFNIPSRIAKSK
nr:hypothetical protein [uncultured Allomuricauda sp.]